MEIWIILYVGVSGCCLLWSPRPITKYWGLVTYKTCVRGKQRLLALGSCLFLITFDTHLCQAGALTANGYLAFHRRHEMTRNKGVRGGERDQPPQLPKSLSQSCLWIFPSPFSSSPSSSSFTSSFSTSSLFLFLSVSLSQELRLCFFKSQEIMRVVLT